MLVTHNWSNITLGKTSTIVALIQLLVELNKSVVITSHTHSAVDNVCLRLMKYGVQDILRLGNSSKIHKNLVGKAESEVTKHCKTPEELEKCYNNAVSCFFFEIFLCFFWICVKNKLRHERYEFVKHIFTKHLYLCTTFRFFLVAVSWKRLV